MENRIIGRIVSINNNELFAELIKGIHRYTNLYDDIQFIGEIGSYVVIEDINRKIICEIVAVNEKSNIESKSMSKAEALTYLKLNLVGEIIQNEFKFGVTRMPQIYSNVKIINKEELDIIFTNSYEEIEKPNSLSIGKGVIFQEYDVRVNIDAFFGFHFAVLGNTGAGKSNTIARIIQNIFNNEQYPSKGARFIILDSNGEFESAFKNIGDSNKNIKIRNIKASLDENSANNLVIPVWALTIDDWAILLQATEKTQVPILKRAMDIVQLFNVNEESEENIKIRNHILAYVIIDILTRQESDSIQSNKIKSLLLKFNSQELSLSAVIKEDISISMAIKVKFGSMQHKEALIDYCKEFILYDFSLLLKEHKNTKYSIDRFCDAVEFAILYEGSITSNKIYEYSATLLTRLEYLRDSSQGQFFKETEYNNVEEYMTNLLNENQIINIDISSLDDNTTEVVSKVLAKMLFDYLKKLDKRNSQPVNLILEEAHRYVKEKKNDGVLGYDIFERIAKEGRKYGLLLGISSQRPSELSSTVVSQCSNFIIHRIQNPDDINYISRMVPYINKESIDRLTYLKCGYGLVFGTAISIPTLTVFEQASPPPYSANAKVSEIWYDNND